MNGKTCFGVFKTIKPHFISIIKLILINFYIIHNFSQWFFFSIFSFHTKSDDQPEIDPNVVTKQIHKYKI
jgi:hypothetical protein